MSPVAVLRQGPTDRSAVINAQITNARNAGCRIGERSPVSSAPDHVEAKHGGSSIREIGDTVDYLFKREGDAIRRLRVVAAELGLALMLCDENGRAVAIDEPEERAAAGGISPKALQRVCDYIERNLDRSLYLDDLARVTGLSRCHFVRAFKQSVGTTPHYYLMQKRAEYASELLRETDIPLAQIALRCGFSDQSHLCRSFRMFFHSTPRSFRKCHR